MPYTIDRNRALTTTQIVAILAVRSRKVRSRVVFVDNSLYHTLTRPKTFLRMMNQARGNIMSTSRATTSLEAGPPNTA